MRPSRPPLRPAAPLLGVLMALLALSHLSPGARTPSPLAHPAAARSVPRAPIRDCNGNGIDDAIDIALGTSSDVDFDGVPDECQNPSPLAGNPR